MFNKENFDGRLKLIKLLTALKINNQVVNTFSKGSKINKKSKSNRTITDNDLAALERIRNSYLSEFGIDNSIYGEYLPATLLPIEPTVVALAPERVGAYMNIEKPANIDIPIITTPNIQEILSQEEINRALKALEDLVLSRDINVDISNSALRYALADSLNRQLQDLVLLVLLQRALNPSALGGPLYNEDNPIEDFNGRKKPLPEVRYNNGGNLFLNGGDDTINEDDVINNGFIQNDGSVGLPTAYVTAHKPNFFLKSWRDIKLFFHPSRTYTPDVNGNYKWNPDPIDNANDFNNYINYLDEYSQENDNLDRDNLTYGLLSPDRAANIPVLGAFPTVAESIYAGMNYLTGNEGKADALWDRAGLHAYVLNMSMPVLAAGIAANTNPITGAAFDSALAGMYFKELDDKTGGFRDLSLLSLEDYLMLAMMGTGAASKVMPYARNNTRYTTSNVIKENKAPTITEDNAALMSDDAWNLAWQNALGNEAELARLRALHFKTKSGTEPNLLYHNTNKDFTVFDTNKIGTNNDEGFYGKGFYMSPDEGYSSTYGPNQMLVYAKMELPFNTMGDLDRSAAAYNFNRPEDAYSLIDLEPYKQELNSADGVILTGPSYLRGGLPVEEVVVANPNLIKSANTHTYFKEGDNIPEGYNVGDEIPISMRDNFNSSDIRFFNNTESPINNASSGTGPKVTIVDLNAKKDVPFDINDPDTFLFIPDDLVLDIQRLRYINKGGDVDYLNSLLDIDYDTIEGKLKLYDYIMDLLPDKGLYTEKELRLLANELFTDTMYMLMRGNAGGATGFGTVLPSKERYLKTIENNIPGSSKNIKLVKSHEREHAIHEPEERLPDDLFNYASSNDYYYFTKNHNSEVGARLSLIMNKFGITDMSPKTGNWYKKLVRRYLDLNGVDNDVSALYNIIESAKDGWNIVAEWANKPKNLYGYIPAVGISAGALLNNEDSQENNYALGGNLFVSGRDTEEEYYNGQLPEVAVLPNPDPSIDYYQVLNGAIVPHIMSTDKWLKYWGDLEGTKVNNAMNEGAKKTALAGAVLATLPYAAGCAPELIAGASSVASGVGSMLSNPVTYETAAKMGLGLLGGETFNTMLLNNTGKTWGEHASNIANKLGLFGDLYSPTVMEMTNLGYLVGEAPSIASNIASRTMKASAPINNTITDFVSINKNGLTYKFPIINGNLDATRALDESGNWINITAEKPILASGDIYPSLPLGKNLKYRNVGLDAVDSYIDLGVVTLNNSLGFSNSRYPVPDFSEGKPNMDRDIIGNTWLVSKPESNLGWETVKGKVVTPTVNRLTNMAPITEFTGYRRVPEGYLELNPDLTIPEGYNLFDPKLAFSLLSREEQMGLLQLAGGDTRILDYMLENNYDRAVQTVENAYAKGLITENDFGGNFVHYLDWSPETYLRESVKHGERIGANGKPIPFDVEDIANLEIAKPTFYAAERDGIESGALVLKDGKLIVSDNPEMSPYEWVIRNTYGKNYVLDMTYTGIPNDRITEFIENAKGHTSWTSPTSPDVVEEYATRNSGGVPNYNIVLQDAKSALNEIKKRVKLARKNGEDTVSILNAYSKFLHRYLGIDAEDVGINEIEYSYIPELEDIIKKANKSIKADPSGLNGGKVMSVTYPKNTNFGTVIDAEGNSWINVKVPNEEFDFTLAVAKQWTLKDMMAELELKRRYNMIDDVSYSLLYDSIKEDMDELEGMIEAFINDETIPTLYLSTDEIVENNIAKGRLATRINNVRDTYNHKAVDDIVLHRGTPKKSFMGNIVMDPIKSGIYKGIIPLGTGIGLGSLLTPNASSSIEYSLGGNLNTGDEPDLDENQIKELIKQGYLIEYI